MVQFLARSVIVMFLGTVMVASRVCSSGSGGGSDWGSEGGAAGGDHG